MQTYHKAHSHHLVLLRNVLRNSRDVINHYKVNHIPKDTARLSSRLRISPCVVDSGCDCISPNLTTNVVKNGVALAESNSCDENFPTSTFTDNF